MPTGRAGRSRYVRPRHDIWSCGRSACGSSTRTPASQRRSTRFVPLPCAPMAPAPWRAAPSPSMRRCARTASAWPATTKSSAVSPAKSGRGLVAEPHRRPGRVAAQQIGGLGENAGDFSPPGLHPGRWRRPRQRVAVDMHQARQVGQRRPERGGQTFRVDAPGVPVVNLRQRVGQQVMTLRVHHPWTSRAPIKPHPPPAAAVAPAPGRADRRGWTAPPAAPRATGAAAARSPP